MSTTVPIDLLRLRSATTAYLAILRGSVPALEGLPPSWSTEPDRGEPMTELRDSVLTALDVDDAPGTQRGPGAPPRRGVSDDAAEVRRGRLRPRRTFRIPMQVRPDVGGQAKGRY